MSALETATSTCLVDFMFRTIDLIAKFILSKKATS